MEKKIKKKLMINCKEATYLFSKSLETKLCFLNNLKLKFHLMLCKNCKKFSQQIKNIETTFPEDISDKNIRYFLSNNQKNDIKENLK